MAKAEELMYLFNSKGEWVAFVKDTCVYDTDCYWIGWLPWDKKTVVSIRGEYLGTIMHNERFYRLVNDPYQDYDGDPGTMLCPVHPGCPQHPGMISHDELPHFAEDINFGTIDRDIKYL